MTTRSEELGRRRLMTFEAKLRHGHNFVSALSTVYREPPPPSSLVTQYDLSVDQFCRDLSLLLKR
jgi:hypothetical protein